MKVTSERIFNTLVEQNILKSDLTYSQLIDSKLNILIKKKTSKQELYYVDLWQSFFNLNTNYLDDNLRPEWIDDLLIDNQNGYSSEINDAAIYKNFKLFKDYFLLPNYEVLVDDFFNKSKEENLEDYGYENPLTDCQQFKLVILSDHQLKKELAKYKTQTYKNLADYYIKTYKNKSKNHKQNHISTVNRIKRLGNILTKNNKYKFMHNDDRIHKTINALIEIVDDNFQKLYDEEIEIPFPSETEYSTKHLTKLY